MRNNSCGGGCGSLREAMRRGARESTFFPRRRRGGLHPRRRAMGRAMSNLLSEYWLQYVALKIPDTTEELFFAFCETDSRLQLLCNERDGTHEISDLEKSVFVWSYVLGELPFVAEAKRVRHGCHSKLPH